MLPKTVVHFLPRVPAVPPRFPRVIAAPYEEASSMWVAIGVCLSPVNISCSRCEFAVCIRIEEGLALLEESGKANTLSSGCPFYLATSC